MCVRSIPAPRPLGAPAGAGTVSEFHINFPDPWFKKRHHRRRLIKPDTVALLTSRLIPGGTLTLATDIVEYADMAHETLSNEAGLCNALDSPG